MKYERRGAFGGVRNGRGNRKKKKLGEDLPHFYFDHKSNKTGR
jgi:hypothetical protein